MSPDTVRGVVDKIADRAAMQLQGVPTARPLEKFELLPLGLVLAEVPRVQDDPVRLEVLMARLLPFLQGTAAEPDGDPLFMA